MTPPFGRKWRGTKEPIDEGEREEWKSWLKLNIHKKKTISSGPITSWEIDGETVETVANFIFLGSTFSVDGDCSHEIKRRLLLGRKTRTNLGSMLQSRDITNKSPYSQNYCFPVVMYGCESWTITKAECQRIDAFKLWCWRGLLSITWTVRRSNWLILKEIIPECSLEGLMLKLNVKYFDHLIWRANSLEKTLMLGKIEAKRKRGQQWWLDGITDPMDVSLSKLREMVKDGKLVCYSPWANKESDMTERLNKNGSYIITKLNYPGKARIV